MASKGFTVVARQFSSSSVQAQLVKTPIQVFGTEGRYAAALYSAASKQKSLDAVEKDLKSFQAQMKKDTRLAEFLADPSVKRKVKSDGLAGACDKMKLNVLSKNLLMALAENGRVNILNNVLNSFSSVMAAHRGEVVCEVTTAKKLDAAMQKEIDATLTAFLKKGQKSLVTYKVDPSIIGGMIVSVGDRYADMSISAKMQKYTAIIKSAA